MIFCGQTISPGEQRTISIPVTDTFFLTAICFCGASEGKTLVITAGVHGCEYVGVEALRRLAGELEPRSMSGNVILLPLANPSGFYAGVRQVVPEDGINLNRAFPGSPTGSLSAQIAYALEASLYPAASFLADLHSGDCGEALHPLVFFPVKGEEAVNRAALAAAQVLTVPLRVRSAAVNGLYSWAVQKGVPALLIERGGHGLWSEEEVYACREDVYALLRHLSILPGEIRLREQKEIIHTEYTKAEHMGFWYPRVKPGAWVRKGELLGRLESFSGQPLQEITAEFDGVVLYYTLSLGVKKGDSLVAYGRTD